MTAQDNLRKPQTKYKDPQAVKPYGVDWSPYLSSTDSIVASTWSITVGDNALIIDSSSLFASPEQEARQDDPLMAVVWLSAGEVGKKYWATNHVVSDEGIEDDQSIIIAIKEM
jgi:hypothetical protein